MRVYLGSGSQIFTNAGHANVTYGAQSCTGADRTCCGACERARRSKKGLPLK